MKNITILCVGGDSRQIYMSRYLAQFAKVYTFGINELSGKTINVRSPFEIEDKIDVMVLPLMKSELPEVDCGDLGVVNCSMFVPALKKNAIITGGRLSTKQIEYFSALGFDVTDYFKREELVIKNCIPTAEGALQLAMQELATTVYKSKVLVIGYGRVGKACGKLFDSVGAKTVCTARKLSSLAEAENDKLESFHIDELYGHINGFDLIINTVPAVILDKNMLKAVAKDTLIIDLASKPGGVDFEAASELNKKVIHALSLPGKVAPVTSGEIIAKAVINAIIERGG